MSGQQVNNCTRILLLLLAAVLLLPVYGSWIDFRYPASQPTHKHIYLGKVDLNHHRSADTKDVVNLPDQDATSQPVVIICLPEEEMVGQTAESGNLSFELSNEYLSPEDAFLPPPDHPPRI
jgi:hypothetical protein